MEALAILRRSDNGLVCVMPCLMGDALDVASLLSKHQAFSVSLVAILPGLSGFVDAVHAHLAESHVANGWFATSSLAAVCAALTANNMLDESSCNSPSPSPSGKPSPEELLKICPREEAPVATVIKKALKRKLGPEKAKAALTGYREVALRTQGVCKRFLVNRDGLTMQLATGATDSCRGSSQPDMAGNRVESAA